MNSSSSSRPVLFWLALAAIPLAILCSEMLSLWWKNPPEPEGGRKVLTYSFPRERENAEPFSVSEDVVEMLSTDQSQTGWIEGEGERRVSVNYFEWDNTEVSGLADAFNHPPEECMGNIGKKVQAFLPSRQAQVDGETLVFDATQFTDEQGGALFVFKLSWAEGMEGMNLLRKGPGKGSKESRSFKLRSVMERWFPHFARVLMLGVHGTSSDEEAWEFVKDNVLGDLSFEQVES